MVQFFVTGFGPFTEVVENPTAALVKLVEDEAQKPSDPAYRVLGTKVLDCAAHTVRDWLEHVLYKWAPPGGGGAAAEEPLVMLHMGVDTTGRHFKLERQAANEASFRVPDQAGWQPACQPIDDHPGCTLATRLHTDIDVAALAVRLAGLGHDVRPSQDAGRFVCNWTYYLSLLHSQKQRRRRGRPVHALFLHVPPVTVSPLGQQLRLLRDLLAALAEQLAPAAVGGGDGASREAAVAASLAQVGLGGGRSVAAAVAAAPPAAESPSVVRTTHCDAACSRASLSKPEKFI